MRKVTEEQRALIEKAIKGKTPINAIVTMDVTGGYNVSLDGEFKTVRAYLPRVLSRVGRHSVLNLLDPIPVRIKEFSEKRQSVVVSAIAALKVLIYEEEHRFMGSLEVGHEFTARVQRVMDFGAFVRIGAVDGLLHKSKMPVPVKRGQEIKVRVAKIDTLGHRVSLEMDMPPEKRKTPKPWKPEEDDAIRLQTLSAARLRKYLLELGTQNAEEIEEILKALKKRNDWGVRKILSGNADWWTAYEGLR